MSKGSKVIVAMVAAVVVFSLGIIFGKNYRPTNEDIAGAAPATAPKITKSPPLSATRSQTALRDQGTIAERVTIETTEILDAAVPGHPNHVLIEKMRGALNQPDKYKRAAHWQALLSLMRFEDIEDTRELFKESCATGRYHPTEFEAFWAQSGVVDPSGTLDVIASHHNMRSGGYRFDVMNAWGQKNGSAAIARALAEHHEEGGASDLFSGAIAGWATHDWPAATNSLMTDVPESERSSAIGSLTWAIVYSGGIEEAQKWFAYFGKENFEKDPSLVKQAHNTVLEAIARGDGDETTEFMLAQSDQPWFDRSRLDQMLAGWSQSNPERVLDVIGRLPADEENLRWIDNAVSKWTAIGESSVGNWLIENKPSPAIYDRVTAAFSERIRDIDPEAARAWMETIEDPELKRRVQSELERE